MNYLQLRLFGPKISIELPWLVVIHRTGYCSQKNPTVAILGNIPYRLEMFVYKIWC